MAMKVDLSYRLRDNTDVLGVLDQPEDGLGPGAVGIGAGGSWVVAHYISLAERAKVERVNDPVFVALAADELVECRPNLGNEAKLLALLILGRAVTAGAGGELRVELTAGIADGAAADQRLQNVSLGLLCCCHSGSDGRVLCLFQLLKYNCLNYPVQIIS